MELQSLSDGISRGEARKRWLEYRKSVKERHDQELEAIMKGYRAISRGQLVISLRQAIVAGGLDDKGRPRIAVCRADAPWCTFEKIKSWSGADNGKLDFAMTFRERGFGGHMRLVEASKHAHRQHVRIVDPFPEGKVTTRRWQAMVPLIPASLRPAAKLHNFHILWEAEWTKAPPVDPALLRHLHGDLYVVLAQWDLTPLERAVLEGRL